MGAERCGLELSVCKEAEKQATLNASSSQDVSFSVTREEAGSYTVFINGLSGSFAVVASASAPPPEEEEVTSPSEPALGKSK